MQHPGRKRYKGRKCNVKVENVIQAESVIKAEKMQHRGRNCLQSRKCNTKIDNLIKVENVIYVENATSR